MRLATRTLAAIVAATAALLAAAALAAPATVPTKSWHVRELRGEGQSCGTGSWAFTATWKPITHEGRPWPRYKVSGNVCKRVTYACTAAKCTAQIAACTAGRDAVAMVTADIGSSVSGMRSATVAGCK